jgi:hypothetical protein
MKIDPTTPDEVAMRVRKVRELRDAIGTAGNEPQTAEKEALREMLYSARADLDVIREALGVPVEPHQSLIERMVEAAQARRGRVTEGWKPVPVAFIQGFNVLAHNYSLRAEPPDYYSGMAGDAFRTAYALCGQDLAKLQAMLAAAPAAPDHSGDAHRPDAEWYRRKIAETLDDDFNIGHHHSAAPATAECRTCNGHGMVGGLLPNGGGYQSDQCPECSDSAPAPAEVPMPEPDASLHDDGHYLSRADLRTSDFYHQAGWRLDVVGMAKASTYGAACRAAGEAAGYARGLAESGSDAKRYRFITDDHADSDVRRAVSAVCDAIVIRGKGATDAAIDALREKVKPAKCDGNHGGPQCADPECWNDDAPIENGDDIMGGAA